MNRKIGCASAAVNALMVLSFALCMIVGSMFGSYLSSFWIALSFVGLVCTLATEAPAERRAAAYAAMAFAGMYALCNAAVYFTQMTTVRLTTLNDAQAMLIDYRRYGLLFALDLMGYGLMALSTFFAGLALVPATRGDRWLRALLLIHGVFAPLCFLLPLLGLFHDGMVGGELIGTAVMMFWCVYFTPVGVLAFLHFRRGARA